MFDRVYSRGLGRYGALETMAVSGVSSSVPRPIRGGFLEDPSCIKCSNEDSVL